MPEEIQTTVKVPLSELVASLRRKHELPSKLIRVKIEGNNIVLNFVEGGLESVEVLKINEPVRRRDLVENQDVIEEEPSNNEENMNEETTDNEESSDEEPTDEESSDEEPSDEEARERKRFWRK